MCNASFQYCGKDVTVILRFKDLKIRVEGFKNPFCFGVNFATYLPSTIQYHILLTYFYGDKETFINKTFPPRNKMLPHFT